MRYINLRLTYMYNPPWCGWNLFEFIRAWIPVYTLPTRVQRSWSTRRGELDFPRVNMATYGGRAFAYSGPTSWNCQPDSLNDINLTLQTFKRSLKTFLFSTY